MKLVTQPLILAFMIRFTAKIEKEGLAGEKLGWSYVMIGVSHCKKLNPGVRRAFRVKGKLDNHAIARVSLLPVRGGKFLLPFNASMRKGTGKKAGDKVKLELQVDNRSLPKSTEFLICLRDAPEANNYFKNLNTTNKNYFYNWINGAKTIATKSKRIARAIEVLEQQKNFTKMVREDHASRKMNPETFDL